MASAPKTSILRGPDEPQTAPSTPPRLSVDGQPIPVNGSGQVNYAPGTNEPVPTAPTTATGAHRHHHHHHHHQPHQEPHPDFSLAGNHPLYAAQYGAYAGNFPGNPYGIAPQAAAAGQRKAEPLYGLGKPLPTSEEVNALKKIKAEHGKGHHHEPHSHLSPWRGHTPRTSDVEATTTAYRNSTASVSDPQLKAAGSGSHSPAPHLPMGPGAPPATGPAQYVVATPDLLRALIAEASLLHPMSAESRLESLSRANSIHQEVDGTNGTLDAKDNKMVLANSESYEKNDSINESESSASDSVDDFPNAWARFRHKIREPAAEFLGTCLLICFGTGVNNQVFLSTNPGVASSQRGQFLSISFGWGIGVLAGVYTAGGISGGHINPAVTLSLAVFRGFPWKKVIPYWCGQILGAFTGALLTQSIYTEALNIYEGGNGVRTTSGKTSTAGLFYTIPLDYMSDVNCFFSEFMDTAILLIIVLAIGDRNNSPPPDGMNPFVLLWIVVGLGACLGMQTAYAVNPARDFGPRIMAACFGYGSDVWDFRSQYWLWTPWIATCTGGLFGCFVYDLLIYTGSESPLNKRWKNRLGFSRASKPQMPAGPESA